MMVIFQNAVITNMAVRCPWWSENPANFTKFELEQLVALWIHTVIKDLVAPVSIFVFLGHLVFTAQPRSPWSNSRVRN